MSDSFNVQTQESLHLESGMTAPPETMRQVWIMRHGPPEVLEVREAAVQEPAWTTIPKSKARNLASSVQFSTDNSCATAVLTKFSQGDHGLSRDRGPCLHQG
jgi:hypothetical protein